MSYGMKIRAMRQKQNLNQEKFAKKCCISLPYLSKIERGLNDPNIGTLKRIAKALGVHILELFEESDILVIDLKRLRKQAKKRQVLSSIDFMKMHQVASILAEFQSKGYY